MPYCIECGQYVESEQRFCRACGAVQAQAGSHDVDTAEVTASLAPTTKDPATAVPAASERSSFSESPLRGRSELASRRRLVQVAFIAYACAAVASILATANELSVIDDLRSGHYVSPSDAENSDSFVGLAALAYFGAFAFSVVAYCRWLHAAYGNLERASLHQLRFTKGWAVGSYFVPFVNLVRPLQATRELWWRSEVPSDVSHRSTPGVIGWWWGFWILGNVFSSGSWRTVDSGDFDALIAKDWLSISADVALLAAAILAIRLVGAITDRQILSGLDRGAP